MIPAPRTILVIDDDEIQALMLSEHLTNQGFQVDIALTGSTGLQKIRAAHPDLIILDLVLPDISGSDVCSQLRADRATRAIPIILCSATKISPEDKVKGFRAGADDYLVRPFELAELSARIEAVLRRAEVIPKVDIVAGIQELLKKNPVSDVQDIAPRIPKSEARTVLDKPVEKPAATQVRPASFFLKRIWELLNFPERALKTLSDSDEFFIAVVMVAGTPVIGSLAKLFHRGATFDTWIGGFALGLVVHMLMWVVIAFVVQMALPFVGCHVPIKRALAMAGIAWAPRFIYSILSVVYALIASVSLAGEPASFSGFGLFNAWSAWILVAGIWAMAPHTRRSWNSVVVVVGVSCFLIGALFRF